MPSSQLVANDILPLLHLLVEYAQVLKMLGDGRLTLQCYDDVARTGKYSSHSKTSPSPSFLMSWACVFTHLFYAGLIRGTMRRRVWINTGDIVLVGLREFQPDKADVIHKYTADEARNLQAFGELPASARINTTALDMAMEDGDQGEDLGFDFDEVDKI